VFASGIIIIVTNNWQNEYNRPKFTICAELSKYWLS